MAATTLHTADTTAKPALHEDLQRLSRDAGRMEDALRGIAGVLNAICYHGMLDFLPKEEEDHASHVAATSMLRLLENHVTDIINAERDWDLSCELVFLADKAKDGTLVRCGELVPEPR